VLTLSMRGIYNTLAYGEARRDRNFLNMLKNFVHHLNTHWKIFLQNIDDVVGIVAKMEFAL
jgi:hypothetical protein